MAWEKCIQKNIIIENVILQIIGASSHQPVSNVEDSYTAKVITQLYIFFRNANVLLGKGMYLMGNTGMVFRHTAGHNGT